MTQFKFEKKKKRDHNLSAIFIPHDRDLVRALCIGCFYFQYKPNLIGPPQHLHQVSSKLHTQNLGHCWVRLDEPLQNDAVTSSIHQRKLIVP